MAVLGGFESPPSDDVPLLVLGPANRLSLGRSSGDGRAGLSVPKFGYCLSQRREMGMLRGEYISLFFFILALDKRGIERGGRALFES